MAALLTSLKTEVLALYRFEEDAGEPDAQDRRFAAVFESAPIGMALIALDGRRLRVNRAFCQMLGYSEGEMLSRTVQDITHPDDVAEDLHQRARLCLGEGRSYQREKRYLHNDGHIVWGQLACTLLLDTQGRPLHFVAQVQDVTERKLAEQALRESEARFRSLTMLSSDWYWEQDAQFRFVSFAGNEQLGLWRPDQQRAMGKRRWEMHGLQPISCSWEQHRATLDAHQPFRDFVYMRVLGSEPRRYLSASGEPVFDSGGQFCGYRGTARDITASKLAEESLRDTQAMLHMAAQVGRLGAWTHDVGDAHVTWSEEVCAIHEVLQGYKPTLQQAVEFFAPEYRAAMSGVIKACLRDGSPFDVEAQIITAKGRRLWTRVIGEAEWDAQGKVRRIQGACQDTSESKQAAEDARLLTEGLNAELEERVQQRTAQLEMANKELEAFSYSIAHDLRAPLGSIEGFSQILAQSTGPGLDDRHRHYLNRIRAGVRQMGELTDGLLALANLSRAALRWEPVDLASIALREAQACRERAPERAVQFRIAPQLRVNGDPRLLAQVIGNLVGNAWKFTAGKADALIEVGSETASQAAGEVYFVRDNGAGFDMAHAARMFEAFQRMHSATQFEGNGIGLAIVQKIVARHGGRIWGRSAPGEGACFYFTLGTSQP